MPAMRRDRSFLLKASVAIGLVAAADGLFYDHSGVPGWTVGLFALALLGAALATHRALRRNRTALCLSLFAFLFALIQIETVSLLAWALYWLALMLAVMASRAGGPPDVWPWIQRLVPAGFYALVKPALDIRRLWRASPGVRLIRFGALWQALILPLIGGGVFLLLFATANPVISTTLGGLAWPDIDPWRLVFWGFVLVVAWCVLRPPFRRKPRWKQVAAAPPSPVVSAPAMLISLALFNLLFAIENGLDLAFLWSGAPLPGHVTMADYAHRGAFSLIVAALLVAAFVLTALDPRSPLARVEALRRLVILWIVQTLFLVASSILRTWDYVEAYSLTGLRVCALAWMGLVAVGLVLVCWRLLGAKTSAWLVNANLAAAGAVLAVTSMVDVNALSAGWNVRHAREVGGAGVEMDVCYLSRLGESGMVPLAEALREPINAPLRGPCRRGSGRRRGNGPAGQGRVAVLDLAARASAGPVEAITRGLDWRRDMAKSCEPITPLVHAPLTSAPRA